jgi:hypothetical protein
MRNEYNILAGKLEGKRPLGRPRVGKGKVVTVHFFKLSTTP